MDADELRRSGGWRSGSRKAIDRSSRHRSPPTTRASGRVPATVLRGSWRCSRSPRSSSVSRCA